MTTTGDRSVLVNDLDLVVTYQRRDLLPDPDSSQEETVTVYGNSRPGGDRLNNLEQVRIESAPEQTIEVLFWAYGSGFRVKGLRFGV